MFRYLLLRLFGIAAAVAACVGLLLLMVQVLSGVDPATGPERMLSGDFGVSTEVLPQQPVGSLLSSYLPDTLLVMLGGALLGLLLALGLSGLAVTRPGSGVARVVRLLSLVGLATPPLWLLLLVLLQGSARPLVANEDPTLVLGAVGLFGLLSLPGWTAVLYNALSGVMRQGYMRMARARGVPARGLVLRHALRNAFRPRALGWVFVALLLVGGAALAEALLGVSGAVRLLDDGLERGDGPLVLGVMAAFMALSLAIILVVELVYALTNPRFRA